MLLLNARELHAVLDMPFVIQAMENVFKDLANGAYVNPLRMRVRPDASPNWMTFMPVLRSAETRRWALKQMVVSPANRQHGLEPLQGTVLLQDGDDGRLLAVADAATLTTIRTAAVTALATRALANPQAALVAIIGTGFQARAHVQALRAILPRAVIRVWGRTPEKARRFAEENSCELGSTIQETLRDADVVCTITSATDPIIELAWLKPGCHVNAVGSSKPTARELDAATIAAATLFVDSREAALAESGDILGALQEKTISPAHIRAELGEVLLGRHPGRTATSEFTLYKSLGLGAQDLAALELAMERASALGRGINVDW